MQNVDFPKFRGLLCIVLFIGKYFFVFFLELHLEYSSSGITSYMKCPSV
jgi:hypothetical protein